MLSLIINYTTNIVNNRIISVMVGFTKALAQLEINTLHL